jgi:REP-associated tyrosine transposase
LAPGSSPFVPRRPREEVEGGIYHVYARGNAKQAVYLDDVDRRTYLRLLGLAIKKRRWRCLAYCLMDNHVHLLLETPHAGLAVGMQWLHGVYAQTFNERHGRVGHLFQGRYGSVRVTTDAQLWALLHYVGVNPVEAGLCASPSDWRWGSYAALQSDAPAWLNRERMLGLLSGSGGDPWRRNVELVEGGAQ